VQDEEPVDGAMSLARHLPGEPDTLALGAALAKAICPGMVVYLRGDLGAGKTTLTRGLLHALGHPGRVKSPTYTLVELYNVSKLCLYHFDFYRLEHPQDWLDAGFREHFGGECACLVEWPEKAGETLPAADLEITLEVSGTSREARLKANTDTGRRCLESLTA
jgi:tRNA threonylcarbamoyladenosine biosynthesis protein TsaE